MKEIDFGRDFNQREYWIADIKIKLAILKLLQEDVQAKTPEEVFDYHGSIAEQLKE